MTSTTTQPRALCTVVGSPDDWNPPREEPGLDSAAVCAWCPVQAQCLDEALRHRPGDDHGIRAGTTSAARRALRAGTLRPGTVTDLTPEQAAAARTHACHGRPVAWIAAALRATTTTIQEVVTR